jgi:hypothetical protein
VTRASRFLTCLVTHFTTASCTTRYSAVIFFSTRQAKLGDRPTSNSRSAAQESTPAASGRPHHAISETCATGYGSSTRDQRGSESYQRVTLPLVTRTRVPGLGGPAGSPGLGSLTGDSAAGVPRSAPLASRVHIIRRSIYHRRTWED